MNVKIVPNANGVTRKYLEGLTIFSHESNSEEGKWIALPRTVHCDKYLCLNMEKGYVSHTDPDDICYPKGKLVFGD